MNPFSDLLAEVRPVPPFPTPRPPELIRRQTSPPPTESPVVQQSPRPLRKRHSAYTVRTMDRPASPIPELPPNRPPRNPARASTAAPVKSRSRPSTATDRDEVTPWDSQPGPPGAWSSAPSVKSKASSTGLSTGPVEEVTPWELFPVPALPTASPRPFQPTKATGLTEDVAPWELTPAPAPTLEKSRSHPASLLSEPGSVTYRLSTATGPTEEVAPWELEPTPEDHPLITEEPEPHAAQRNSLTMTKAQLEEVVPWELYPPPPPPVVNPGSSSVRHGKSGAQPARNSSSKSLSDFTFVRRRRSTGNRPQKYRSNSQATSSGRNHPPQGLTINNGHMQVDDATTPKSSAISSTDGWPNGLPSAQSPTDSDIGAQSSARHTGVPKFSTADRTILEELKRNIRAKNAQFVLKGTGVHLIDGSISAGKKHHPYASRDVPYPRSYEREVIDLDVWETLFCQEVCESLTWHVFEEPPLRVLDIGCGTGTWILNCARQWRDTQFVGLDIVPLHPDLQQVGSPDLASRITWTQYNFLDGLPFPNDEFDLVHIKRIALGVPEDKWVGLFDEISRVLKPGGAFEMVEEDLFFPGKPVQDEDDSEGDRGSVLSRSSSMTSGGGRRELPASIQEDGAEDEAQESFALPPLENSGFLSTPSTMVAFPRTPTNQKRSDLRAATEEEGQEDMHDLRSQASTTPPGSPKGYITLVPPHSRSAARPTLYVKASHNTSGHSFFASTSPPKTSSSSSYFSHSAAALLNSLTHANHTNHTTQHAAYPESDHSYNMFRRRRSSSNLTHNSASSHYTGSYNQHQNTHHTNSLLLDNQQHRHQYQPHHNQDTQPPVPRLDSSKTTPFLLRTPAKAPMNPRDHSLLEYIYSEMLSSRFINSSPLSLLANYMGNHFKDTRTHPPLLFAFPPLPVKHLDGPAGEQQQQSSVPTSSQLKPESPVRSTASSRKTFQTAPTTPLINENGELPEEHRWLSMQGLIKHSSPFISLDGTRNYSATPSGKKPPHQGRNGKPHPQDSQSRIPIPNKTLNIDLRTLNLHLMLRVKEILACSETMWEWVRDAQHRAQQESPAMRRVNGRGHSLELQRGATGSINSTSSDHKAMVRALTREEFNQMLVNFEMDMQDQVSLNTALKERFSWQVINSDPTQNRKIFTTACEKYEKWQKAEGQRPSSPVAVSRPQRTSVHLQHNGHSVSNQGHGETFYTRNRSNSQTFNKAASSNGHAPPSSIAQSHSMGSTQSHIKPDPSVHFAATPKGPVEPAPYEKLSRAFCVFVAWKAKDTPSETHAHAS